MKNERIKNSMFNSISNMVVIIFNTIVAFILRTFFIKILGEQCLGLDGLFTNILSLLSLAELGFSTAVSFNLYKPLADNDIKKVNTLIIYFKKVYRKIAFLIFSIGILILPFLSFIIKGYDVHYNIYFIYLLYLINTVCSYFISYSNILIEADQKNYLLTKIRIGFDLVTYTLQIISLFVFKNFIVYLLIQFILRFIQRVVTNNYIQKKYKNIDFNADLDISNDDKKSIKKNIVGLIYHKIGDYAVNGTDNILISSLVNISTTGVYSNYLSIIGVFRSVLAGVFSGITSSLGNANAIENEKVKRNIFETLNFFCYFSAGILVLVLYFCINDILMIWLGKKFIFSQLCTLFICINFYLYCVSLPITAMKNSAGIYYEDRFVPIIQAILNLLLSVILGVKMGVIGIVIGTTISSLLTTNTMKPYIIYKKIFASSSKNYYINLFGQITLLAIVGGIINYIQNNLLLSSYILMIIIKALLACGLYSIIFVLVYRKDEKYKYYKNYILSILKTKKN